VYLKSIAIISVLMIFVSAIAYAQPKKGMPVPEIMLRDTSGNLITLSSLKGKVVLIEFWASWCGPCRKSNPALIQIYSRYKSRGFEIYGISIDQSSAAWKNAIEKDRTLWTQVIDRSDLDTSLARDWKIDFIPASFLVSREGKVIAIDPNHYKLKTYLKKHLSETGKQE
jgi:thiol-disulfide isomerase/thioredoxin